MNVHSMLGCSLLGLMVSIPTSGCEFSGDGVSGDESDQESSFGEFIIASPSVVEVTITNAANEPIPSLDPELQWGSLRVARSTSSLTIEHLDMGLGDLVVTDEVGGSFLPLHLTDVELGISAAASAAMTKSDTQAVITADLELNWSLIGSAGQIQALPSQTLPAVELHVTVADDGRLLVETDVPGLLWDFGEIAVADLIVSLTVRPAP